MTFTQESFSLRNTAGDVLSLNGPGIYVLEHAGLGRARASRATQQGPYQHGQSLLAARLLPRTVTLRLLFRGSSESDLWAQVDDLQEMLNQVDEDIYLDVTLPSGAVRRLAVQHQDGLTLPRRAVDVYNELTDVVQLVADDPILYAPTAEVWAYSLGTGEGSYVWPLAWPISWGASTINLHETKLYSGTWLEYPVITVAGPATGLIIENETTGETLDFTSYTLDAGHTMVIDLRYGYKTIALDGTTSLIDKLVTATSHLATWHLAPHPEAAGGLNTMHIQCSGASSATRISFLLYRRYIGL